MSLNPIRLFKFYMAKRKFMKEITKIAFDCGTLSKKRIVVVPERDKMFDELYGTYFLGVTVDDIYQGIFARDIGSQVFCSMLFAGLASAYLWKNTYQYFVKKFGIVGFLEIYHNLHSFSELQSTCNSIAMSKLSRVSRNNIYDLSSKLSDIAREYGCNIYDFLGGKYGMNSLLYYRAQCVFRLGFSIMMQYDEDKKD